MNQEQKKYFLKRMEEITAEKRREAEEDSPDIKPFIGKLRFYNQVGFLTSIKYNEIVTRLKEKLKAGERFPSDSLYSRMIEVSESGLVQNYEEVMSEYTKACQLVAERNKSIQDKIEEYGRTLSDKLVLGDAEEALKGLEAFKSRKF